MSAKPPSRGFSRLLSARWAVMIAAVLITIVFGAFFDRLRHDTSMQGSIPAGDPSQEYFETIKEDFGNDQVAMLVIVADGPLGVFAPSTLRKIDAITERIDRLHGVDDVVSLTNARFLSGLGGEELTNELIVPEIPDDAAAAGSLREDVLANPLFHRVLTSKDGRVAALNIFLSDVPDSVLFASGVDDSLQTIARETAGPEELHYAGTTRTRVEMKRTMRHDLKIFVPLAFGLVLTVLVISFRQAAAIVVPAITILMATVWTFGLMALAGTKVSLVMTMVPPLIIVIGCSLSLHVIASNLHEARAGRPARETVQAAFAALSRPLLVAGLTTAIGFAALMISPVPNIFRVGVYATIGILIVLFMMFTLVPAAFVVFPLRPPRSGRGLPFAGLLQSVIRFNKRRRHAMLAVAAMITLLSLIGLTRIRVDTDFLNYFKEGSPVRRAAAVIEDNLAGVNTFYVIATSDSSDAMRETRVLRPLSQLQDEMEAMPEIDKASSMIDMVQLFHQAMNEDDPDSFVVAADQATLDEEIFLTVDSEEPEVRARYVVEDYSSMAVFVRAKSLSTSRLAEVIEHIETRGAELMPDDVRIEATGTSVIFAKSISSIVRGQRDSLALALGVIFVLMALLFRSIRFGLLAMVPNFIPVAFVLGMMGWLEIPLSIGTSVVATIALGIGVDDTIHYFMHYRRFIQDGANREEAVTRTLEHAGPPFILTSLSLTLGFLVLCFSDFGMLISVGVLTAMAMVACLASDLVLTSALLLTFGQEPASTKEQP